MPRDLRGIRIFVALPNELVEELKAIEEIANELNLTWPEQRGVVLEVASWRSHSFPSAGRDAQQVINVQIREDFDILLGVLWGRAGTPTPRSLSGTIEEFENAYRRWKEKPGSVGLMMYFKEKPIPPQEIDLDQLRVVREFRSSLEDRGVLYWTFSETDDFPQLLRVHLARVVEQLSSGRTLDETLPADIAGVAASIAPPGTAQVAEEEGFLDMIEESVASSERAGQVIGRVNQALEDLNLRTIEVTEELNSLQGDASSKLAAQKRLANRQAGNMADFASRMQPEMPILEDAMGTSLEKYGQVIAMLPDFGANPSSVASVRESLVAVRGLGEHMARGRESMTRFRTTIANLPRVTTQFGRAKRQLLSVLDSFITSYDRGLNLIPEVEKAANAVLAMWSGAKMDEGSS